jgi:SAM-dependent methyltransferase
MRLTGQEELEALYERYGGLGQLKIDLGCGYYKPPGYIGLDNLSGLEAQDPTIGSLPDIEIDLDRERWPFPDESVATVRTSHYLEHSLLDPIFREANRVLVPGGLFDNTIPYALSDDGLYPGHPIFLTEKWFEENLLFQRLFRIVTVDYFPSPEYERWPWWLRRVIPFSWGRRHLFNVCIAFRLVAERR